jgi:hypothetical protein
MELLEKQKKGKDLYAGNHLLNVMLISPAAKTAGLIN